MRDPKSILITGASSGIGEALARCYAGPGVALALTGRDTARLAAVTDACAALGARVVASALDVIDGPRLAAWIGEIDAATPLDLVIANAGVSGGSSRIEDLDASARRIFATNVDGVFNTIHPAIPGMTARGRGQIAIMASLAGFRGLPGAAAYAASKAAVRVYGEALRGRLRHRGVGVSVICPGFVESRMTASNRFPMPFLWDADRAARRIARDLAANRPRIAFPWPLHFAVWLAATLPTGWTDRVFSRLPEKT
ncbi:MAG: SDR family NAD(P)-dependent oxidoreductase [Alphaproteobacteria bacterium]|nr:SDR family NAD(P)-dependent oxidoreductase [Alphaproteobacteria bacterium]